MAINAQNSSPETFGTAVCRKDGDMTQGKFGVMFQGRPANGNKTFDEMRITG